MPVCQHFQILSSNLKMPKEVMHIDSVDPQCATAHSQLPYDFLILSTNLTMPKETMHSDSVHPQCASALIQLPYDVRSAILDLLVPPAVHLYRHKGNIVASICVSSDTIYRQDLGSERKEGLEAADSNGYVDYENTCIWARRLRSTWGPHWRCEERALRLNTSRTASRLYTFCPLLGVCRKL
jgi:hypothetical protein